MKTERKGVGWRSVRHGSWITRFTENTSPTAMVARRQRAKAKSDLALKCEMIRSGKAP